MREDSDMGFVNYIPRGAGKMVVIMLKFPFQAGESDGCRKHRNVALTRNFKRWLSKSIGAPVGHQAGDVNSVEFFWNSELDAVKVNQALNTAPFCPEVAEAAIRFQDHSAIAV